MWSGSECTCKCRSKRHMAELISGLTKCAGESGKKFALMTCRNFWRNFDSNGRNLLLWACSTGNAELLEFILANFKVDSGWKDLESGYSALHRAILYGQIVCAQILIDYGVSLAALDHEGLTAMDIYQRDRFGRLTEPIYNANGPTEVYSMGDNMSYNLGHSLHSPKPIPEPIEFFRHANIFNIQQVKMSKFHSLFLTTDGRVYSCGHGIGGRLGLAGEEATLEPKLVELPDRCVELSCANDHSIFLTATGVFTCGLNSGKQLGHQPVVDKLTQPKLIGFGKSFRDKTTFVGCSAGLVHSAIWTRQCLFTFGTNAGQLGHLQVDGSHILSPKLVSAFNAQNAQIVDVVSTDSAIALYTDIGNVHLLHQWKVKRILSKQLGIKSLHIIGGNVADDTKDSVKVAILTKSGTILMWSTVEPTFRRCVFNGLGRQLYPTDICLITTGLYLITPYGNAYRAKFDKPPTEKEIVVEKSAENRSKAVENRSKGAKSPKEVVGDRPAIRLSSPTTTAAAVGGDFAFVDQCRFLHWPSCYQFGLTRIAAVHRGIRIFCPPDGRNVVFLQQHPAADLTDLPTVSPSEMSQNFRNLLDSANSGDFLHDLTVKCDPGDKWPSIRPRLFPSHKYILSSRSTFFARLIAENDAVEQLLVEEIHPDVFAQLLTFVYTDSCDWLQVGHRLAPLSGQPRLNVVVEAEKNKKKSAERPQTHLDPLRLLADAAKKLGVKPLLKRLDSLQFDPATNCVLLKRNYQVPRGTNLKFDRSALQPLYDCTIVTSDREELSCHRCVLSARLDYFNCMFNTGFMESRQGQPQLKLPVDHKVMIDLLHFIYSDELLASGLDDIDRFCRLLLYADQFLIPRLRQICEVSLSQMVSLRNVAELLQFAHIYHANQLKSTCVQFVSLNLSALLESNQLKQLSRDSLEDVGNYYRQFCQTVANRRISPYQCEPSGQAISELISTFDVSEFGGKTDAQLAELLSTTVETSSQPQIQRKSTRKSVVDTTPTSPVKEEKPIELITPAKSPTEIPVVPANIWSERSAGPAVVEAKKLTAKPNLIEEEKSKIAAWPKRWSFVPPSDVDSAVVSLRDVMLREEKMKSPVKEKLKVASRIKVETTPKSSPWATVTPPLSAVSPQQQQLDSRPKSLEFSTILSEESARVKSRQQQEKKSFALIQVEERAMGELLRLYRAAEDFDQLITVERVSAGQQISDPIWKAHVG